ncbi:MAG: CNNM domain-containing protein [Lachnospiraceae bacterium]|nr:CNNM domain-containing protein [Lachnospiraceae bacterium]
MDSSVSPLMGSVIFVILLLLDFILTGFSSAVQSISESAMDQQGKDGDTKSENILDLKNSPKKLIYACWFYHIVTSAAGTWLLLISVHWPGWSVLLIAVVLIYLFGKAVPSMIGKKYAEGWCGTLFSFVSLLITVSYPFTYVLALISHLIVRMFGVDPHELEDEVTEDEIISMVNEGHEQGVLDEHEAEMIQNIFEMDDKEAQDIMTHRKNISAISGRVN